jgi:transcription elongation factor Elf1
MRGAPEGSAISKGEAKSGEDLMEKTEKQRYAIGDRVEKMCAVCGEERGHIVALLTKQGSISRVSCAQCGTRSTYKSSQATSRMQNSTQESAPYNWSHTYRKGQTIQHPIFGPGEVTAVIGPDKIDVLFLDRVRRLVHARSQV